MEGAITPPMRSDGSSSVRGWEQASRAGPGQCNVVALSEAVLGQEKAVEILACLIWILLWMLVARHLSAGRLHAVCCTA